MRTAQRIQMEMSHSNRMIIIMRNEAIPIDRPSHIHEVGDQQTAR